MVTSEWGWERLFGVPAGFFFTKTAVPRKRKVGKWIRRCKMHRLLEIRVFGPKKTFTCGLTTCSNHDQTKLCKQKSTLFPNKYQSFSRFWMFFFTPMIQPRSINRAATSGLNIARWSSGTAINKRQPPQKSSTSSMRPERSEIQLSRHWKNSQSSTLLKSITTTITTRIEIRVIAASWSIQRWQNFRSVTRNC